MCLAKRDFIVSLAAIMSLALWICMPATSNAQTYPNKPITIYCGYVAGGPMDLTARELARGAEEILGAPVVVEDKPGGGSTVAASLLGSKRPDGYTLAVIAGGALIIRPHLMKLTYNPLEDFTPVMQYSRYLGSLCVLGESPFKTIEELIAHAKTHPGVAYGSPGMYTQQHISVELLAQCKGLKFKHVPFKGATEAATSLMGKHIDFLATGGNIPYVKKGLFRMLLSYNTQKRFPEFPDVPTLKELGCEDCPGMGIMIIGPKGLPKPIVEKLGAAFKKISETPNFKQLLASFDLPYEYKDEKQMEKEIVTEHKWFETYLKKIGAKKQD